MPSHIHAQHAVWLLWIALVILTKNGVFKMEIIDYVIVAFYAVCAVLLWRIDSKLQEKKLFIAVGIVAALSGCAKRIDRLNACYLCCLDRKTAEGAIECGQSCKTDNRFCKVSIQTVKRMEAEHGK